jgi:hypothetical protein
MKVGDSNTAPFLGYGAGYLTPLGAAGYNPGASGLTATHPELLDTWAAFRQPVAGAAGDSFDRVSTAAYPGWLVAHTLQAAAGEVAATNAGVALVMIGTNDVVISGSPDLYRGQLALLVRELTALGVVPILSTLPDNLFAGGAYGGTLRAFNEVIADVGGQFRVPVWNLNRGLAELPNAGLDRGGVHLSASPNGGGSFAAADLAFGQNLRNLQALEVLDWFREQAAGGTEPMLVTSEWVPLPAGREVVAVGPDVAQAPVVTLYDAATGAELNRLLAYDPAFTGGVRVAVADANGDGFLDVVTGSGLGGGPQVNVFSGADGSLLGSFFAFDPAFRTGVNVAAGDLGGDGPAEIVAGAGNGGGPMVAVFRGGDFAPAGQFFAFDPAFRGGVNVAVGHFAGLGPAVVAGAGVGGGSIVGLFPFGSDAAVASFYAFDPGYRDGVSVAAGDLTGDGFDEVAVAPTAGSPHVRVLDPLTGAELAGYFAGDPLSPAGVRLAVRGGRLFVGNGPGGRTSVQAFPGLSAEPQLLLDETDRGYGVFVG